MIKIQTDYSLKEANTFKLDCTAAHFIESDDPTELASAWSERPDKEGKFLILGGGSNILLRTQVVKTVIHPVNREIRVLDETRDEALVSCGAGLEWDELVDWTVNRQLGGLENLSLIPGTAGAAPVQNIGAYGAELADTLELVRVLNLENGKFFQLTNEECKLGYRESIFKQQSTQNWLIWEVIFRLEKDPRPKLTYKGLRDFFPKEYRPEIKDVREAVIKIRRSKLPDPAVIGNAGSFFKNPVISACQGGLLRADFPEMPFFYHGPGTIKIPAGWLIENSGWKGYRENSVGVYHDQALVLVNYGEATGQEIISLAEKIIDSVKLRFGIKLEPEVRIV